MVRLKIEMKNQGFDNINKNNEKKIDESDIIYFDTKLLFDEKKDVVDGSEWITIEKIPLRLLILQVFADPDKQKILCLISEKAFTIPEILQEIKLPTTAGYRKINSLIQEGFVVPAGMLSSPKKREVRKYRGIFEDVKIYMDKNKVIVQVKLKRKENNNNFK
jgi:hypothetical protein